MKDLSVTVLLDQYGGLLREKQRMLMACYYNEDLSLSEIAENEGMTRQAVSDALRRALNQLRQIDACLGLLEKQARLQRIYVSLAQSARRLQDRSDPAISGLTQAVDELGKLLEGF